MKKYLIIFGFIINTALTAQVVCVNCYQQNAAVSSGITNLLMNGGFETGCSPGGYFCPNSLSYSCDITNWICSGGGDSTYATMFGGGSTLHAEGAQAAYFGNSYCNACSSSPNDTSCLNNASACIVNGIPAGYPINDTFFGGTTGLSLEQTVSGLVPGNIYVLEFWAGGEWAYSQKGLFAVNVGFGNIMLRCNPTPSPSGIGTRYIIQFAATSASHTIKFTNWGHICSSCTELVLDDVRLYTQVELSNSIPHCSIGINEINKQGITIFPNPFSTSVTFRLDQYFKDASLIVCNSIGQTVKKMDNLAGQTIVFHRDNLPNGLYFVQLTQEGKIFFTDKLIITDH